MTTLETAQLKLRPLLPRTDLRISVTVMHHPARANLLPPLLRACAPLRARVVTDPDPTGIPSPLRTAKCAWAAVADGATHHLVLQDDVVLSAGFAGDLRRAVRAQPHSAIALHTNWNSPENAHRVRLAAAAGAPFAPLSAREWAPTLGFLLPAPLARDLAGYLARFPDEVRDDDELVIRFCRARCIPVLACVPHLIDHGHTPTLAGHEEVVHATVFAGADDVGPDHWTRGADVLDALRVRTGGDVARDFGVDLSNSRCALRLPRRNAEEPVGHRFGWYWYDWCHVVDVDPLHVIDTCVSVVDDEPRLFGALPTHLATEVWAAGYLLGHDAAGTVAGAFAGATPPRNGQRWRDRALDGWITQGIAPADDRKLTDTERSALASLARRGLARGWSDRSSTDRGGRG